jgi:CubicO group peptidase (beta-lactamase class C family)
MRRSTTTILALLLASICASPAVANDSTPPAGLDEYVEREMAKWQVPGLALAIVKDGEVVIARGYGTRTLGSDEPVDEHTIFAIGSQTKAFTTAALAVLVDEGKLRWDDKVTDHLRGFQLHDPAVTRELTVRDIVTHRSGLERGDLLWYLTDLSREEILHRVRLLEPSWSFRSTFGYQNIMFLAAGQLVPAITGESWDAFVSRRLLGPLGMERSSTSVTALARQDNVATPHELVDDVVVTVPWKNIDNIAPAGSINSSAAEMARWVRMQLAEGELDGRRIVSAEQIAEMHRPQMLIGKNPEMRLLFPEADFASYGLGWFTYVYRGETVVEHGGAIDGMRAQITMIPERELGVVLLSNLGSVNFTEALRYRIFDAYLGEPEHDWSATLRETFDALVAQGRAAEEKHRKARLTDTSPSRPLGDYAGAYRHPMYGELEIAERGGVLHVAFGIAPRGALEHWHLDVFRAADWPAPGNDTLLAFRLDVDARVTGVELPGIGTFERPAKQEEPAPSGDQEQAEP